ncbi:MAG: glycoside hydrolase family 32 protein [Planctomycetota bacterium]
MFVRILSALPPFAALRCAVLGFIALGLAATVCCANEVLESFDGVNYAGWQVRGDAFGDSPATGTLPGQQEVQGFVGAGLVNSFLNGDRTTGEMLSEPFVIDADHAALLVGGGRDTERVFVELVIDGERVAVATGAESEQLAWANWDVREHRGRTARIRIVDNATGGWGHLLVDAITLTDEPIRAPGRDALLAAYRTSAEYLREPWRPQVHFTPEIHWMNDPNGLVYHRGEYHLFYQYNPFGIAWGHMSWGHAVSPDLMHWEHLPVALWEEGDEMIFSGCAVVDRGNTSGFGTADNPPLVAVYTSHRPGNQAQSLAYSTDDGRTWTKHAGNPVLDIGEADFRDPKVFWHEPTERWVMVVSLAVAKRLQFYGSDDLKSWKLLSEFGPAGAEPKPNWECPDLFELPIEDARGRPTGRTAWVLEVDMGGGSVAGGSGGEYFVGDFDGQRFACHDPSQPAYWVDYGRDFYAPVSWSDIPADDGRRIWIGWMNNWETHLLPTDPWRSAMSVPRTLSLRETADGLRLVQRPVRELEALRGPEVRQLETVRVLDKGEEASLVVQQPSFSPLDLVLECEVQDDGFVWLDLLAGGDELTDGELANDTEATRLRYDASTERLSLDRTRSGEVDFHEKFAGVHTAPLTLDERRLQLRIILDASSVEVFAQDGRVVLTDRVFPSPGSHHVRIGGAGAEIKKLQVWPLRSIWRDN